MHIGVIAPGFSAADDDWAIPALRDLVGELARCHDVRVTALRYPPERSAYPVDGALVTTVGGGQAAGMARLPLLVRAARDLVAAHRRRPFDLLHGFWADEPAALAVGLAGRFGVPAVVSVMGGELEARRDLGYGGSLSRINRRLSRFALRRADVITAGSEQFRAAVADHVGRPVELRPLGVDTSRFAPDGPVEELPGDPPLLHVASLTPVKGGPVLLHAFSRVREQLPGARLHVAGDGPLRDRFETAPGVVVHGHVRHDGLARFYRGAALHVQASHHESQGMAALEAAACGRVTVGTRVGILPDIAPQHVVAPGDPEALAAAVGAALTDRERLAADGAELAERVRSRYGLDERTLGFEQLYEALVTRNRTMSS